MFFTPKCVLIVEDSEPIRRTFQRALEREGYTVYTAENGAAALELLETIPAPGLVLLDLAMPVMNGEEFLAVQSASPRLRAIPTVVLTAANDISLIATTKPRMVVNKPINLDTLLGLASSYCGLSA